MVKKHMHTQWHSKEKIISLDKMEEADSKFKCKVGLEGALEGFDSVKIIKKRENDIDYRTITSMPKLDQYAGEQGIITPNTFDQVLQYEGNPKNESCMSEEVTLKIALKRDNKNQK